MRTTDRVVNESPAYRKARRELVEAEIALRHQTIAVAELRRTLPLDTVVPDYEFDEGPGDLTADEPFRRVSLADLFVQPDKPLIVYHLMYGGTSTDPCPMCSMWIDGFNGVARHVEQRANFAVVAQAPVAELRAWGRHRGWDALRLLSAAPSTFKTDLGTQTPEGDQRPSMSVFSRSPDGIVYHFWTGEAYLDEATWGGLDTCSPVWHLFDLTPQGRGDWVPQLEYPGHNPHPDPSSRARR